MEQGVRCLWVAYPLHYGTKFGWGPQLLVYKETPSGASWELLYTVKAFLHIAFVGKRQRLDCVPF